MDNVIQVGDRFINNKTGETYLFRATAVSTQGAYVQFDNLVPAGMAGPPLHIHPKQEEQFTVLSGVLYVVVAGEKKQLKQGEAAIIPKGIPHTFDNKYGEAVSFRVTLTPALDSDQLFVGLVTAANEQSKGRPNLRQLAKLFQDLDSRFDIVGLPSWIQRPLFRLLAKM